MHTRRLPNRFKNPVPYISLPATCSRPFEVPDRRTGGLIRQACRSRWCSQECTDKYNYRRAEPLLESYAQGRQPKTYLVLRPTRRTSFRDFMECLSRFTARARRRRKTFEFFRAVHFTRHIDPHAHFLLIDDDVAFLTKILEEDSIAKHLSLESMEPIRECYAYTSYVLRTTRDSSKKIAPPTWAARYRLISFSRAFLNGKVDDLRRAARERRYGKRAFHLHRQTRPNQSGRIRRSTPKRSPQ